MILDSKSFEDFEPRRPDGSQLYCSAGPELHPGSLLKTAEIDPELAQKAQKGITEAHANPLKAIAIVAADIADKDEPDAEKAAAVARWQDQCFLIDGWKELAKMNQKTNYENIIPVGDISPAELMSILSSVPDAENFFNLTPAQLSLLVPTIRLFVVDYAVSPLNTHHKTDLREIHFDDYTHKSDIERILQDRAGRGSGAGIKSFSYVFDGRQPETTENSIRATLQMVFTDISIFTKKQRGTNVSFLDLVEREGKHVSAGKYKKLNPEYTRIMAQVGWAIPEGKGNEFVSNSFFNNKGLKGFNKLLEKMQLQLFLEMGNHELKFDNDGKVELTVNYRASIESDLLSEEANLFLQVNEAVRKAHKSFKKMLEKAGENSSKAAANLKRVEKEKAESTSFSEEAINLGAQISQGALEAEVASANWLQDNLGIGTDSTSFVGGRFELKKEELQKWYEDRESIAPGLDKLMKAEKALEAMQDDEQKLIDKANQQISLMRYRAYQSFLNKLIARGFLRFVDVPVAARSEWQKDVDLTFESQGKGKKRKRGVHAAQILKSRATKRGSAIGTKREIIKSGPRGEDAMSYAQRAEESEYGTPSTIADGDKRVYYIYFGDLIDVAMGIFADNTALTRRPVHLRTIVSNIMFTDPYTNKPVQTNLCDMPVALDEFIVWYKNKVISPMRKSFTVMDFLKSILGNLAQNTATAPSCFGDFNALNGDINIEYVQMVTSKGAKEPLPLKRLGKTSLRKAVRKYKKSTRSASSYINYMVLHAAGNTFPKLNPSNVDEDNKNGHYHLGIGLDRGIVKDIKFKANKIKYSDEYLIVEKGMKNLGQLFTKYDADVRLWGCSLFRNGQIIYLDPNTMGIDSSTAKQLGLGGYHMIVNVSGELTSAGYFVDLSTKYQSPGIRKGAEGSTPEKISPGSSADLSEAQRNVEISTEI